MTTIDPEPACTLILTTCPTRDEADRIAETLVEQRLAACVQIEAIDSVYRWQGKLERTQEWPLQIKTTTARADEVEARVVALHSYEVPEIVRLTAGGSAAYLAWIAGSVD